MVGNGINRLLAIAHGMAEKLGLDTLAAGILKAANAVSQGTSDATKALRSYARSFQDEAIPAAAEYSNILGAGGNSGGVTGAIRQATVETEKLKVTTAALIPPINTASDAFVSAHQEIRAAARQSVAVTTAELIPSVSLTSDAFVSAHQKIRAVVADTSRYVAETGPTWGQTLRDGMASVWNSENVTQTIMGAFQGGGGLTGGIQALGAQMGGTLAQSLQTKLSGLTAGMGGVLGNVLNGALGMALPVVGPMLGKLAGKVAGAIGKGLKKLFGGPSKEVENARKGIEGFAQSVQGSIGKTAQSQDHFNRMIADGWERNRAVVFQYFIDQATSAGKGYKAAESHWLRYQRAMEDGNQSLMRKMEAQAKDWATGSEQVTRKATEAVTHHAQQSEKEYNRTGDAIKASMKGADDALSIPAFRPIRYLRLCATMRTCYPVSGMRRSNLAPLPIASSLTR